MKNKLIIALILCAFGLGLQNAVQGQPTSTDATASTNSVAVADSTNSVAATDSSADATPKKHKKQGKKAKKGKKSKQTDSAADSSTNAPATPPQ
ncbi:MAG: hypothetical protein WCH99_22440 [Verrucomicrobiota bacterium]